MFILVPLILSQLLQRFQDVVDNRFITYLGSEALAIHNVQFNIYFVGQEIGLAAAMSALIFWRRKESEGKQGFIFKVHLIMPIVLTTILAAIIYHFIMRGDLERGFSIPVSFSQTAHIYWVLGLINMVLRSIQIPLTAILIACDERLKCILLGGGVLIGKVILGWSAIHLFWNSKVDPGSILIPLILLDVGAIVVLAMGSSYAVRWISSCVDGWAKLEMRSIFKVWPGELGIAAVNSVAVTFFGFQLAKVGAGPEFFVTYQLALGFSYILALPVIAGMQIAVRDASAAQSKLLGTLFIPLHESQWWPQFFYASLMPTCILFGLTAVFAKSIFYSVYNYNIPAEHLFYIRVFFASWILWEFGDVFLIMLRAAKRNTLATRNFIIASFGVEVGLTQLLLWLGWANPITLSFVMFCFCATYLLLNRSSIFNIQSKYFVRGIRFTQAGGLPAAPDEPGKVPFWA